MRDWMEEKDGSISFEQNRKTLFFEWDSKENIDGREEKPTEE